MPLVWGRLLFYAQGLPLIPTLVSHPLKYAHLNIREKSFPHQPVGLGLQKRLFILSLSLSNSLSLSLSLSLVAFYTGAGMAAELKQLFLDLHVQHMACCRPHTLHALKTWTNPVKSSGKSKVCKLKKQKMAQPPDPQNDCLGGNVQYTMTYVHRSHCCHGSQELWPFSQLTIVTVAGYVFFHRSNSKSTVSCALPFSFHRISASAARIAIGPWPSS